MRGLLSALIPSVALQRNRATYYKTKKGFVPTFVRRFFLRHPQSPFWIVLGLLCTATLGPSLIPVYYFITLSPEEFKRYSIERKALVMERAKYARFCTTVNLIPGFRISAPNHMKVLHIPLLDDESTDLSPFFTTVFKEIDDARKSAGRVLLLCAMGISRSATFAITYLMCIEKMSLHDAYKHVQYCRNIICPNVGFFQQMIDLEQKLYGTKTVRIIEPIPGVKVADVVWNELYQEMMDSLSEADRHSVRSYNPRPESARQQDTRSLRSLNLVTEDVDGMVRELSSCRLAESQAATNDGAVLVEVAPRIPTLISTTPSPYPKSALRDKSKSSKNKRWRLSFSKDVT